MTRKEALEYINNMWMSGETHDALEALIPEFGKTCSDKVIDHEDKYKEALLEARAVLEPCLKYSRGKVREALDSIDRELRSFEDEDERIRKLLIWQVHQNIEDETNDLADSVYDGIKGHDPDLEESIEDWKKCLAYLEKQKDLDKMIVVSPEVWDNAISDAFENGKKEGEKQKENPKSADSIPSDCTSDAKCEDRDSNYGVFPEDVIVVARACEKLKAHGYTELAHALKNVNLYTKEQKPVDYDHEMWKNCEANFEGGKKEVIDHPEKYGLTKQKPADLSKMMVHKEPYIAPVPTPMVADEQKPASISCGHENDAEWGQEDKEKIVTISEIIEHCTNIPYSGGTLTLNKEYKKELLCFIRTLRPSWKPSEEQMKALQNAVALTACDKELARLYNQLKKL